MIIRNKDTEFHRLRNLPEYKIDTDLPNEIWKDVPDEDYYMVSNFGRVRSKDRVRVQINRYGNQIEHTYKGQLISVDYNSNQYGCFNIWDCDAKRKLQIYDLVCVAFGQSYADKFYYGEECVYLIDGELWKQIDGYNDYYVSNKGRVKRIVNNHDIILKTSYRDGHYYTVELFKDRKRKHFQVHRLVATAFISNIENKSQVNHIDGNKLNNNVENLEWVTPSENMKHAYKTGLLVITPEQRKKSQEKLYKPVYCVELNQWFKSTTEASNILNIPLSSICCGIKSHKLVHGFTFERRIGYEKV